MIWEISPGLLAQFEIASKNYVGIIAIISFLFSFLPLRYSILFPFAVSFQFFQVSFTFIFVMGVVVRNFIHPWVSPHGPDDLVVGQVPQLDGPLAVPHTQHIALLTSV